MTDNDIIRIFLPIINAGLTTDGFTNVDVIQSNQPRQQGIPTRPTVYFYKLNDHRYGWLQREDVWDSVHNKMVHTEFQVYESAFQVSALVLQRPTISYSYTASDLVNEVASILQSDTTIQQLTANNMGILRISDLRNPYFVDDMDNFEATPSFDFILTYGQTRVSTTPVVNLPITPNINRV